MIQLLEKQSTSHTLKIHGIECSFDGSSLYLKGSLFALKPFVTQGRIYWKVNGKQVSKIAIEKVTGVVEVPKKNRLIESEPIIDLFEGLEPIWL